MKTTFIDNHVVISDGEDSINLDLNYDTKKVHIWITLPNGGETLTVLQFTKQGIRVV